jgi:hypothetical protein
LSENLLLFVCKECAIVHFDIPHNIDFYDQFKSPNIVKTYIPYAAKTRHLTRLQKWSNYSHKEVQLYKLIQYINEKVNGKFDREVIDFTKIHFSRLYEQLKVRAKIKESLMVYCIYSCSLTFKKKIDIDELFKIFKVSDKNYNDLNGKLIEHPLFYPTNINKYLDLIDNKLDKNYLIIKYNKFLQKKNTFNNKTIILGIIYFCLKEKGLLDKKDFFNIFSVSKGSVKNIVKFIEENSIVIDITNVSNNGIKKEESG